MASSVRLTDGQFDFSGGIDSGRISVLRSEINPNGLARNQVAWLTNATVRGGGILQRTGWTKLCGVRAGDVLYQGGMMYEPDNGDPYLLLQAGGRVYQVRVDTDNSVVDLSAVFGLTQPDTEPQANFRQAEQFALMQAGDLATNPLIWDGALLRRSLGLAGGEIPAATAMDYYMGRLWYAVGRTYSAGDIVRGSTGTVPYSRRDSVLKVTENPLAIGGDGFTVPENAGNIRALSHSANLDSALGESQLFVFTRKSIYSLDVPVTRKAWIGADNDNQPRQRVVQKVNGTYGERSVVSVNGDLFYQSMDGIRSLMMAIRNFPEWANTPISNNMQRVLQFNDRALMRYASGIEFNNRLLQTLLPYQTTVGVAFKAIGVLDFDLITSLGEKLPPAWEGIYEGLAILQLFEGDFGGRPRAFAVVLSQIAGDIEVWELSDYLKFDNGDNRVTWGAEFPACAWGREVELKQLDGGEIWFDKVYGTVEIMVEYRVDADPCWNLWHKTSICVARSSCETVADPVCYPEQPYREGYRFSVVLPKPPYPKCAVGQGRPVNIGFYFQTRVTVKGWARVRGIILHALPVERQPFANLSC